MIAEDNFLIREGYIEPLLREEFSIVASVDNGQDAVAATVEHQPAVVLLDISIPGWNGFDTAQRILAVQPRCRVLFVTNYAESLYVQAAKQMGAAGYVFKSRIGNELVAAIHMALAGDFYESRH